MELPQELHRRGRSLRSASVLGACKAWRPRPDATGPNSSNFKQLKCRRNFQQRAAVTMPNSPAFFRSVRPWRILNCRKNPRPLSRPRAASASSLAKPIWLPAASNGSRQRIVQRRSSPCTGRSFRDCENGRSQNWARRRARCLGRKSYKGAPLTSVKHRLPAHQDGEGTAAVGGRRALLGVPSRSSNFARRQPPRSLRWSERSEDGPSNTADFGSRNGCKDNDEEAFRCGRSNAASRRESVKP